MGAYFTYLTGVATLLGFILQLRDAFPKHREARKGVLYVCFGAFLGSVLGAVNSIDLVISEDYGLVSLVLIAVLVVIAFSLIIMTFVAFNTVEPGHRADLFNGIGVGVFVFFLVLVAVALSRAGSPGVELYSVSEQMAMAKYNLENKNYDRAISLYRSSIRSLPSDDPRRDKVAKIIEQARREIAEAM